MAAPKRPPISTSSSSQTHFHQISSPSEKPERQEWLAQKKEKRRMDREAGRPVQPSTPSTKTGGTPRWPKPLGTYSTHTDPKFSDDACEGSQWSHSVEFRRLQDELLEAARFQPEKRNDTFDLNAVACESNEWDGHIDDDEDDTLGVEQEAAQNSAVPASFPPHHMVDGIVELSSYLASSSYIVSLGGPPLADLKYGIIVVPAGEEGLLFAGYGDHAGISAEFKEQIYAKSKATQKEQLAELQQKAAHEWANGVAFNPEIDDDDRDFYRRRWRRRKGLPSDDGLERVATAPDDRNSIQQNWDSHEKCSAQAEMTNSHRQESSRHSTQNRRSLQLFGHDKTAPSALEDSPISANGQQDFRGLDWPG